MKRVVAEVPFNLFLCPMLCVCVCNIHTYTYTHMHAEKGLGRGNPHALGCSRATIARLQLDSFPSSAQLGIWKLFPNQDEWKVGPESRKLSPAVQLPSAQETSRQNAPSASGQKPALQWELSVQFPSVLPSRIQPEVSVCSRSS